MNRAYTYWTIFNKNIILTHLLLLYFPSLIINHRSFFSSLNYAHIISHLSLSLTSACVHNKNYLLSLCWTSRSIFLTTTFHWSIETVQKTVDTPNPRYICFAFIFKCKMSLSLNLQRVFKTRTWISSSTPVHIVIMTYMVR